MHALTKFIGLALLVVATAFILAQATRSDATPHHQAATVAVPAHSHNDYYRNQPLHESLAVGMASIEIDVFPHNDKLMVAHDRHEIGSFGDINSAYLEPLIARLQRLGRVYPGQDLSQPIILLVDFKDSWVKSLPILERDLEPLRPWLQRVENGTIIPGKVMVVVSGLSPREHIASQSNRLLFADGRLPDLSPTGHPAHVAPIVSDRWRDHFDWRGEGAMPAHELRKLRSFIRQAEARGQIIRFWATPDTPSAWAQLLDAGVHLVNTDKPIEFGVWYSQQLSSQ